MLIKFFLKMPGIGNLSITRRWGRQDKRNDSCTVHQAGRCSGYEGLWVQIQCIQDHTAG